VALYPLTATACPEFEVKWVPVTPHSSHQNFLQHKYSYVAWHPVPSGTSSKLPLTDRYLTHSDIYKLDQSVRWRSADNTSTGHQGTENWVFLVPLEAGPSAAGFVG
jgi:hypothetical protein